MPNRKEKLELTTLFSLHFNEIDDEGISEIIDACEEIDLTAGEYLFKQDDASDSLYILLSGRLRAIKEDEDNFPTVLGDIGAGEPVGEFAFFTKEKRMASVIAIRDSVVLQFDQKNYNTLVRHNPSLASVLIRFIVKRMKRNAFEQSKTSPPKNIAIIHLQSADQLTGYTNLIETEFKKMDVSVEVHFIDFENFNNENEIFNQLDQHKGINILTCSAEHKEWSKKCILYADLVIVTTDFYASSDLHPLEKELELYSQNILNKKTYLLLLHPIDGAMPNNTKAWLAHRNIYMHLHLRKNNEYDTRRLCRILSHKATGLVLGGGGAKGFAHIGATQAILEAGLEVDFLGGSSAGALYGLGMSYADFKFDHIYNLNEEAVKRKLTSNDLTFPLLSMLSGKKFKKYLLHVFQNYDIEDLWVNSYAISTNFSKAKTDVHRSGSLWRKVLASMAIPGVFPPVVIDKNLHVDGGVMDNLPIESMYYYPVDNIIAISLSTLQVIDVDYQDAPTSWQLFRDKIFRKKAFKIPGISSIIINSLIINSQQKQEIAKEKVSHYIELDLKGVGMLEDKKWKETIKRGYDQTKEYLSTIA